MLVVLTTVAVAVLAYVLASLRPVVYSADSVLIVPSGAGGSGPGQANEALRLASTYAELIPRDGDLLLAVAEALREPVATVSERLTVSPLGDTALLEVTYTSPERAEALLGSRTAAESVIAGATTSDTVPRGSVRLVGLAEDRSVVVSGGVTTTTVPIGVFLGLVLGGILAVAAERANRRVDSPRDVQSVLDVPVFDLDGATGAQREALVRSWGESGSQRGSTLVAVVGVAVPHAETAAACRRLVDGLAPDHVAVIREDSATSPTRMEAVTLVPAGIPGSGDANEAITPHADLVVLLVPSATRRAALVQAVSDLSTFGGRSPSFVLVSSAVPPRGAARVERPRQRLQRVEERPTEVIAR
jgi:capsular polysaccharide biosynthesis protein